MKIFLLDTENVVWIKGNEEKVQKKLNAPIDNLSVSRPHHQSNTESVPHKRLENKTSRSYSLGASDKPSGSSTPLFHLQKRLRIDNNVLSEHSDNRNNDGTASRGRSEREKDRDRLLSLPRAYSATPAIQRIIDSVVGVNVAHTTPPLSRSNSPAGNPNSEYRALSGSRPTTCPNSPNSGAATPAPTGWTALTSRHSLRRFDIRPWGPRHLEYDYNEARKEFQGAAYFALGQYGYVPPRGVVKFKAPPPYELPSMSDLRKIPSFQRACRRLDAADRALEEALARGETWENTPIPKEYFQFSLEGLNPNEICTERLDNAAAKDRSRSSVTLEEAADLIDNSHPERSSSLSRTKTFTAEVCHNRKSVSTPTTSLILDKGQEAMITANKIDPAENVASLSQLKLTNEKTHPFDVCPNLMTDANINEAAPQIGSTSFSVLHASAATKQESSASDSAPPLPAADVDMPPAQLPRKRLLEVVDNESESNEGNRKKANSSFLSPPSMRTYSPVPVPPESDRMSPAPLTRVASASTSVSTSESSSDAPKSARRNRSGTHKYAGGSRADTPLSRNSSARTRRSGTTKR
ncbi:hypothetical protein EW145_g3100 [Phellinidium pouzarii]|uniref:Uncharacterized protein n=1 Tax=Phellinidium pouzarii TaxID=167371 RepID=A0A4S4L8A8_9AGAM|nr:hypothetical protein EW145_g3100 [Phellinidium pouzarii]